MAPMLMPIIQPLSLFKLKKDVILKSEVNLNCFFLSSKIFKAQSNIRVHLGILSNCF